jgi:hypothetical protein
MRLIASIAGLAFAGLLVSALPAAAETMSFKTDLKGAGEVPPTMSSGTGHVEATFDTATKTLSWTVDYSGLTGAATMAHFHGPAPLGKNAGVMVPVSGALESPIKGSAVLTDDQATALEGGLVYFNIHTAANKGGEIRGQLEKGM